MNIVYNTFFKKCFQYLLFILSAHFIALPVFAQDHSLLKAFPNSSLVTSDSIENVVYQIPLGVLQRDSGRAAPEKSLRVTGNLSKLLYEVSDGFDGDYVKEFFEQQFEKAGLERLFACEGRACGNSNDWANDVFDNRVLYGPSQNQFFMTYADRYAGGVNYFVSYIITRSTGRLYSYIEVIETQVASSDPQALSENLRRNRFTVLANLVFQNDELVGDAVSLTELVSMLKLNPDISLYIVAHLQGEEDFERVQARSQRRADSVAAALVAAGVDATRLEPKGVGPLAPGCSAQACANRVEAVLR